MKIVDKTNDKLVPINSLKVGQAFRLNDEICVASNKWNNIQDYIDWDAIMESYDYLVFGIVTDKLYFCGGDTLVEPLTTELHIL